MVESKTVPRNRGFYVRMKLPHHKNGRPQEKGFFFRYCKWLLWVSLSLYFFSSYFVSLYPRDDARAISLSKTHLKSIVISRALFEPVNTTAILQHPRNNEGLLNDLKVFVYDLPSKYNADWLSDNRCSSHLFASEVAIHRALLISDFRTFDPYEADFFFVPVYVSCKFSPVNGFPSLGHARDLISSAIQLISTDYMFWNRSRGSDHIFVASHDYGACFHAMEDSAIAEGIPEFLKKSIILQTFGVIYKHPCQEVENVLIPPYIPPESIETTLDKFPTNGRRNIFAFFRGKMEVNPKNVSGRFYSKRLRTVIWRKFHGDRRFYLRRQRFAGYQSEIRRSIFCLCPLGWAPWSPRLVESVALGCVPVIIADGIRLPSPAAVDWAAISLTVPEQDVERLGDILEQVASTNLTVIQNNLRNPAIKRALLFHNQTEEGDATWQVLFALSQKLDRSSRRSRVSIQ